MTRLGNAQAYLEFCRIKLLEITDVEEAAPVVRLILHSVIQAQIELDELEREANGKTKKEE